MATNPHPFYSVNGQVIEADGLKGNLGMVGGREGGEERQRDGQIKNERGVCVHVHVYVCMHACMHVCVCVCALYYKLVD